MLPKSAIKACLAGKPTSVVPADLLWFDGKFVEKNQHEVEQLCREFSDDIVKSTPKLIKRARDPSLEPGEFTDDWGCLFRAAPDGVGSHPTRPIITSVEEWERYVAAGIPGISSDPFVSPVEDAVFANQNRYVVAQFWRTFYERMYMLIGFENLMIEIATKGELFLRMLSHLRDFTIQGIELIAEAGADAVFLADDWGTQHRLQISPTMWRHYFKPAYSAAIETAHAKGLDVWFHSCGHITEIIPEWIDLGLDVSAHLQAAALDLVAIGKEYHGQITFFGGIDVQFNLVMGNRDSIREEVQTLINHFHAFEGRYIASPGNSIMPETPVENVRSLFEAIRQIGKK